MISIVIALHFDRITATEVIALVSRTQIDLMKPSERVERTTDTLHHYHKPVEAPGTPKSSPGCGIDVEIVWKYLFPSLMEFGTQIQNPAHVLRYVDVFSR